MLSAQSHLTINSNILRCAEKDQCKPPKGEVPDTTAILLRSRFHNLVDHRPQPDHGKTRNSLNRQDPTLPATDLGGPYCIYNRTPEQLQRVGICSQRENSNGRVRSIRLFEQERYRTHGQAHRYALEEVQQHQQKEISLVLLG